MTYLRHVLIAVALLTAAAPAPGQRPLSTADSASLARVVALQLAAIAPRVDSRDSANFICLNLLKVPSGAFGRTLDSALHVILSNPMVTVNSSNAIRGIGVDSIWPLRDSVEVWLRIRGGGLGKEQHVWDDIHFWRFARSDSGWAGADRGVLYLDGYNLENQPAPPRPPICPRPATGTGR